MVGGLRVGQARVRGGQVNPPVKVPFAVLRSIVRHARDRAISKVCGQCSGLRDAMKEREPDWRDMVGGDGKPLLDAQGQPYRIKCYGQSPWRGVAWEQTDDEARAIVAKTRWAGNHYGFQSTGMYIGIELDGYMHT